MSQQLHFLTCDCGNSTVRIMLCTFDGKRISIENVLSESNDMIYAGAYFYWDILRVFDAIKRGIKLANKRVERIHSIGVCTWGVDFALFDSKGLMIANPLSYRNTIGGAEKDLMSQDALENLFYETGIFPNKINSAFMLRGMQKNMPDILSIGKKLLLVPDILNYFLTGKMQNEPSELSTSQLMDVRSMGISDRACADFGVSKERFSEIGVHGELIGYVLPELCKELEIDYELPVICVPSHDTASAVLGTPALEPGFTFISSGTWALIGMDCEAPAVTGAVYGAELTNEVGAFGRITLLKNSIGMFILQRLKAEYDDEHGKSSWQEITALDDAYSGRAPLYNVNHPDFFNPASMSGAISGHLGLSGHDWPAIIASTHASLAASYAEGVSDLYCALGKQNAKTYVIGGGARNAYINQMFADITGQTVVACDMECACVGNAVAQAKYFKPQYDYWALKQIVCDSLKTKSYEPKKDLSAILPEYRALPV